ncbi:MAG: hypothetical protein ACRD1C_09010 [Terriglobales bacterium]
MRPPRSILALVLVLAPLLSVAAAWVAVPVCHAGGEACPMMRMAGCPLMVRACCHAMSAPAAVTPARAMALFAPPQVASAEAIALFAPGFAAPAASPASGFPRTIFHPPLG